MMEKDENEEVKDIHSLQNRIRQRLFQQKITHAKFYSTSQKELEFLVLSLIRIVGKENVRFLRPVYMKNTSSYLLEVDIRIPEALLHRPYFVPKSGEH